MYNGIRRKFASGWIGWRWKLYHAQWNPTEPGRHFCDIEDESYRNIFRFSGRQDADTEFQWMMFEVPVEAGGTERLCRSALITPEYELGDKSLSTITAFLSRSRCSLDSLHITQPIFRHASLHKADYRAAFPSIKVIKWFFDLDSSVRKYTLDLFRLSSRTSRRQAVEAAKDITTRAEGGPDRQTNVRERQKSKNNVKAPTVSAWRKPHIPAVGAEVIRHGNGLWMRKASGQQLDDGDSERFSGVRR
ncbi:hypothetical protein C8J57DRAFT_1253017 [Mycena rebaudengoi]|nr:hypothetical protein C8J57DRAFT_1253017 [Mycena rebaudengoi]